MKVAVVVASQRARQLVACAWVAVVTPSLLGLCRRRCFLQTPLAELAASMPQLRVQGGAQATTVAVAVLPYRRARHLWARGELPLATVAVAVVGAYYWVR